MSLPDHKFRISFVLLILLHGIILWLLLTRQLDFLFNDAIHRIGPGTDFWAYFNAGKHFISDGHLYGMGPGMGYRYHPLAAMTLFSLLSLTGYNIAYAIWVLFTEVIFFTLMIKMRHLFSNQAYYLIAVALMVCFSPYYLEVYMGNATFISVSLLFFAYMARQNSSTRLFYIFFLVSLFIKPIGILLLPLFLFQKEYKIISVTLLTLLITAIPYFLWYPDQWLRFISVNFEGYSVEPGFMVHAGNQGFYAFWLALSAHLHEISLRTFSSLSQLPDWNSLIIRLIPFVTIGLAILLTVKYRTKKPDSWFWAVWLIVYLVGYKEIWEHSYSMILPVGLLVLSSHNIKRINPLLILSVIGLALPTLFFIYDISLPQNGFYDPDWSWSTSISMVHHATKPFWLLIFVFMLVRCCSLPLTGGKNH